MALPDAYIVDVYFDGVFYFSPLRYENGACYHMRIGKDKMLDYDRLRKFLEETLEVTFYAMFFKLPECELEKGLKIIGGDVELESMYAFADTYGLINMYLAHIPQKLDDYYIPNLCFEDSCDEATSKLRINGIRQKDAGNMSWEELVEWAEEEARRLHSPLKPRHIYEGFKKQYGGVEFRHLFWAASKASYPGLFNKIMGRMKRANPGAYQYLLDKDPKTWSRAYFHIGSNCEAVENGFSECFNSVLVQVRDKPLISMLEAMRVIVMERMNVMRKNMEKWNDEICSNIQKRLELLKNDQSFWHVIPAGGAIFEVRNGSEAFGVDEKHRTCSCRMWPLSGLPCSYARAVIFKLNRTPEEYVPDCFRKHMFYATYRSYLQPVDGMSFWSDCSEMSRVLPPKPKKMSGRPRKKRIRSSHESKNSNRVPKSGCPMTCILHSFN